MNEPLPLRPDAVVTVEPPLVGAVERVTLDGRHPMFLDRRGRAMQVVSGLVDVFAVGVSGDKPETARHHLFRVERGEIFADMFDVADASEVRIMAVGGADTEALVMRCVDCSDEALQAWLAKLSTLIAGPSPSWDIQEATNLLAVEIKPGDRRRGPARNIVWLSVAAGNARLMGQEPAYQPDSPPVPLSSGMWIVAGEAGCTLGNGGHPTGSALHQALDHFHRCAAACIGERLQQNADLESQRLIRRTELTRSRAMDMFDRLSSIIIRPSGHVEATADASDDPLLAACRTATRGLQVPILAPPARSSTQQTFTDVIEIARASRLRVRQFICP